MKKRLLPVTFLIIFSIVLLSVTAVPAAALAEFGIITGNGVRVRSQTNTSSSSVIKGSLPVDTVVTILSKVTGTEVESGHGKIWYKIADGSLTGYVYGYYLKEVTDPEVVPVSELTYKEQLAAFPSGYQAAIKNLHSVYPNWVFVADPIDGKFNDYVIAEAAYPNKCVSLSSDSVSWYSMEKKWYDWTTGKYAQNPSGWTGASREVIAYYMDPRNFLNSQDVYMFMQLSFDSSLQNKDNLKKMIKGTFLDVDHSKEKNYFDAKGTYTSYADVIMEAARRSGVSPYALAATILQEQGINGTSSLISGKYKGYEGYYNFFNYNAAGTSVIVNGLKYAKQKGWNSRSASIFGGAEQLGSSYVGNGQDTYYYKDFDVKMKRGSFFQYAQAVYDAKSSSAKLRSLYMADKSLALVLKIPVFKSMPSSTSLPAETDKCNNYYFLSLSASGLSPAFDMYQYQYTLNVTKNTTLQYKLPSGATYTGKASYDLVKGSNKINLSVKSQTGYKNTYTVTVTASKSCKLTVTAAGSTSKPPETTKLSIGDVTGDGAITVVDLAAVKLHLLGKKKLTGDPMKRADINQDGKITVVDLAAVKLHLLGKKLIKK